MKKLELHEAPKEVIEKMQVAGNILTALEDIEKVVGDDFCFDIEWDNFQEKLATEKEKTMAKKLGEVYRIAHGNNPSHSCYSSHDNWRKPN